MNIIKLLSIITILISCSKEQTEQKQKTHPPLEGTIWVLNSYLTESGAVISRNDSITFISPSRYIINQGSVKGYKLIHTSTGDYNLNLTSFTPLGGNWFGILSDSFFEDKSINNETFIKSPYYNDTVKVWMEMIN